MHAKRERRSDRLFRVRCTDCENEVFYELFDEDRQTAKDDDEVELDCAWCGPDQLFEVVAP